MSLTEKKEICFIAPPFSSTEFSSTHNDNLEGKKIFTAKFPLHLCIGCCGAVKNFAEFHQAFAAAQQERNNDTIHRQENENEDVDISIVTSSVADPRHQKSSTLRSRSRSRTRKDAKNSSSNNNDNNPAKVVKRNLAKLLKDEEEGQHHKNDLPLSTLPPSFFSELPSVLQMELPSGTDMETLRLYSEFHCGGNYFGNNSNNSSETINPNNMIIKRLELNQVENWGTDQEKSTSLKELWATTALMRNPLHRVDDESFSANKKKSSRSGEKNKNANNPAMEFTRDDEVVEHGNLSPFAVPDRNPAVLLSSCSQHQQNENNESATTATAKTNGARTIILTSASSSPSPSVLVVNPNNKANMIIGNRVLPNWEQKWVQENFLSLDSPACCAKAAKVAALAEYLGCMHLVQLCAVVIAARLCERPFANVDHMRWCLMGRSSTGVV